MRRRWISNRIIVSVVLISIYIGIFSFWWLRSPSKNMVIQGQTIHEVQFAYNTISFHTYIFWAPAFWFMEHACGYEPVGYIAMEEKSIMVYVK
jgi:hypothetical protein